jgi:sec-independent protein translocase protein TatC
MTAPEPPPGSPPPAPDALPPAAALATMSLMEHLRELRQRLIYGVGALLLGMLVSLAFTGRVIDGLTAMCQVCTIQAVAPTESFTTYFRVALLLGLVLATPVILYQLVRFVLPALHPHEQRYLYLLLPGASLLFATGLVFGYFVVLPRTVTFLSTFLSASVSANWTISQYVAFVTNLLLIIGITFETPLVVFILAKLRVVSAERMAHFRRHAVILLAVLAAVLTPTPDPFTMFLVLGPMILLYELGILLARFA